MQSFADESGRPISVPVVDGRLAYHDCQYTGKSLLLFVRNALLYLPSMNNHLIPPFMMQLVGLIVKVNECAKFLAKKPNLVHHSIYFPEESQWIALHLAGITSYIPTRTPRSDERDDHDFLELTATSS